MSHSKWVRVGSVRRFDNIEPNKAQALKVLEAAEEVFGAWRRYDAEDWKDVLLEECADVIQATLNLVAAPGVEDFAPYMAECLEVQRGRGRL